MLKQTERVILTCIVAPFPTSRQKDSVRKPAGSKCLCNLGLGASALVWDHAIFLSEAVAGMGYGFSFGVTSVRSPASETHSGP